MFRKSTVRDEKRALRHKYAAIRQGISDRLGKSRAICDNFLNTMAFAHSDTVLLYHSINQEVDTTELIKKLLSSDKRVALPVCSDNGKMIFRYLTDESELTKGFFSAPEPNESCEEFVASKHTLCVIPAIAFDRDGYRLGYGKGYYDRYLSKYKGSTIGVCYSENMQDELFHGKYDRSVDLVVTDKEIITVKEG
jgi:5-formyltetrahydrofolate cyclo-ligase